MKANSAPTESQLRWSNEEFAATHVWRWKTCHPERAGNACRVLAWGGLNSCLVEFSDGFKVLTSRWAVRKLAGSNAVEPDSEF